MDENTGLNTGTIANVGSVTEPAPGTAQAGGTVEFLGGGAVTDPVHPAVAQFISDTRQELNALGKRFDTVEAGMKALLDTVVGELADARNAAEPRLRALESEISTLGGAALADAKSIYEAIRARLHSPIK